MVDVMLADQLAIKPCGGLPVEGDGGVDFDNELAARALVIGRCTFQEVAWDVPMVSIEPADNARPSQRFEAPHVGRDVTLHVAGLHP